MKRTLLLILTLWCCGFSARAQHDTAVHPWQGRRVAYLGDSITDPRNKAASTKYWGWLEQWLSITPYVYGKSGRTWNDIPRQAEQLAAEHGDEVDAILIFIGTNDYKNGTPLGQWYETRAEKVLDGPVTPENSNVRMRTRRTPSLDAETFRGRINIALSGLKKRYPDKQIVLLTPIHRAQFVSVSSNNHQPTEDYCNAAGEFIDAYVAAVREAGTVWSVPVIDLHALSGLFPMQDEGARYFANPETDRLHPNNEGHRRIAATLVRQLAALPCVF